MKNGVIPGIYRHFKGRSYLVLGVIENTDTGGSMVLYQAYYEDSQPVTSVKSVATFTEEIVMDNIRVPRFQFVETYTPKERKKTIR